MGKTVFTPCLDLCYYVQCRVMPPWEHLLLPGDNRLCVDLSKMLFRCLRAIGGGWTEQLHTDPELSCLADSWATSRVLTSIRICPLCSLAAGTPRHVVMNCPAVRRQADAMRDAVKASLAGSNRRIT